MSKREMKSRLLEESKDGRKDSEARPRVNYNEGCWRCIKGLFNANYWTEDRLVMLSGETKPHNFVDNKLNNQKYNFFTFLPKVLYNQFKFFFNLYFLLLSLSQMIEMFKVGFLITYISPLAFVLLITFAKEIYDDIGRYRRDREMNTKKYKVMRPDGSLVETSSADLKVGNIVSIQAGQRIPADLVLLYTDQKNGSVFIKTDQLDGETDWKLRKALGYTQRAYSTNNNLMSLNATLLAEKPHKDIYGFQARLEYDGGIEPASLENTLWANTSLTAGTILALVVYTGKETRSQLNNRDPRAKIGILDNEIDRLSLILFGLMVFISALTLISSTIFRNWVVVLVRYIILYSSIIPISLRVNLDLAKIAYCYMIFRDKEIPETVARNSTIPEELGRIEYLFSDKTGTLTQNCMVFKKLFCLDKLFTTEEVGATINFNDYEGPCTEAKISGYRGKSKDVNAVLKDLITGFAVCHNVTPIMDGEGKRDYQASSPDEIALVKYAESLGILLKDRDPAMVTLEYPGGKEMRFEVLANFPFSSKTKRMGIIVRHLETKKIIFYLKGAEVKIEKKVAVEYAPIVRESAELLALDGLRTLVIAQKELTEDEYTNWSQEHTEAKISMENREKKVQATIRKLENNLQLLGISGVEDKLQENVAETVDSLKSAGIRVWMLTGDKIETAKCIAISSGIKSRTEQFYVLKDLKDDKAIIENQLKEAEKKSSQSILVIDGGSLDLAIKHAEKLFFEVAAKTKGLVCCRCSPTQKTLIVNKMKLLTKKRCAAIGDGGNDVGMIQEGDCGIGIVGKEGMQASLAADFSITKFMNVKRLILWHGRLSYKRSAILGQFVVHRGLIITINQMLFILIFYYCSIAIYNGWLMMGYVTIFTCLPVFSLIMDEDIDQQSALLHPPLYKTLQKGRSFSFKIFLVWTAQGIFQGCVIMMLGLLMFDNSFLNIVTITFSALIVIELLNVLTELHKKYWGMFVSISASLVVYFLTIILMKNVINVSSITWKFLLNIIIITAIAWAPIHIIKLVEKKIWPSDYDIIMKERGSKTCFCL